MRLYPIIFQFTDNHIEFEADFFTSTMYYHMQWGCARYLPRCKCSFPQRGVSPYRWCDYSKFFLLRRHFKTLSECQYHYVLLHRSHMTRSKFSSQWSHIHSWVYGSMLMTFVFLASSSVTNVFDHNILPHRVGLYPVTTAEFLAATDFLFETMIIYSGGSSIQTTQTSFKRCCHV